MWALIQYGWYSYEKRRLGHRHTRTEKRRCEDICKAERETSEETLIPWYQVSSYQYQNCEKVNVSDLSPRACGICYGSPGKLVCYIFDYHGHNTPDFNPSPEKKKKCMFCYWTGLQPQTLPSLPLWRIGLDNELQGLIIRLPQVRGGLASYSKNEEHEAGWQKAPSSGVRQVWFQSQLWHSLHEKANQFLIDSFPVK